MHFTFYIFIYLLHCSKYTNIKLYALMTESKNCINFALNLHYSDFS